MAASTKKNLKYNKNLKPLFNEKKITVIANYFIKNKDEINDASLIVEYEGEFVKNAKKNKPLIHDVMDECISGNYDTAILSFLIKQGANTSIDFFGLPPFYRVLNYVAIHKIAECEDAIKVIKVFANAANYDIKKQYKAELPPFAYLLRKNFEFLGNKYNKDFLSAELIKFFIEKGSNANTYDQIGNNLLTYSVQTNNVEIQKYLANNNVDADKKNELGQDAMYSAIVGEAFESIQEMVNVGYKLEPSKLRKMGLVNKLNKQNDLLLKYLTSECFKLVNKYEEAKNFMLLFDESKNLLLSNNKYQNIGMSYSNIPEFITMLEANMPNFSKAEKGVILTEKEKYINASTSIEQLINAIQIFPLFRLNNYRKNYYASEENTKSLCNELKNITSTINQNLKQQLLQEISNNSLNYYTDALSNSNDVESYIQLSKNYFSKRNEAETQCYNKFCERTSFADGSQSKWSEQINGYVESIQRFINNANAYLTYFNYNNSSLTINKNRAQAALSKAYVYYNTAKVYEERLIVNVKTIYQNIQNTSIIPKYETYKNRNFIELKLAQYNVPEFSRTLGYNKSTNTYYVEDMIGNHGNFNTIADVIKEDMFLNYWGASIWTYKPTIYKYEKMERIIKEYNKYGIREWYMMKIEGN